MQGSLDIQKLLTRSILSLLLRNKMLDHQENHSKMELVFCMVHINIIQILQLMLGAIINITIHIQNIKLDSNYMICCSDYY